MIIHASIPADDPERVARVIAELWGGLVMPFPPVPGVFIAMAGDDRGTQIEVGPRGVEGIPGASEVGFRTNPSPSPYSEVHLNISSSLSDEEIFAIAAREGWKALACDRGGFFKLIEFWLENRFMLEVMNAHEWERYRALNRQMFASGGLPAPSTGSVMPAPGASRLHPDAAAAQPGDRAGPASA
jgi:hypothetical protein